MNRLEEEIIRAVAASKVTRGTVLLAKRMVERMDAHTQKAPIPSVAHAKKQRHEEERAEEDVALAVWSLVIARTLVDHRGKAACEACNKSRALEAHHLEMGAGGRRDAPEVVMALCALCHRTGRLSAHRSPRAFAQEVVIPWCSAHGYPVPNRKEYR